MIRCSIYKNPTLSTINITSSKNRKSKQQLNTPTLISHSNFVSSSFNTSLNKSLYQSSKSAYAASINTNEWQTVTLPIPKDSVLQDLGFVNEKRGFLLGNRLTVLVTDDKGKTWSHLEIPAIIDTGINYRFNSISFSQNEGWIVGQPTIVLYTNNAGINWQRIPISSKLPGTPLKITALGQGNAELITNQGAIYTTSDSAKSWRAALLETVDATLNRTVSSGISGASYFEGYFSNIDRAPDGKYVAVSSRGNFYLTWKPGETYWTPHNRPTGRRIQNMGWCPNDKLWLTTRGGDLLLSKTEKTIEEFVTKKIPSRGYGILDVVFRSPEIGYACGGSGSLYKTKNGGETWERDKSVEDLAGNLYNIIFPTKETGFILGNSAILLRLSS